VDVVSPDPLRLDARDLIVRERVGGHALLAALVLAIALGWTVAPWLLARDHPWGAALVSGLLGLPLVWIGVTLARGALRGGRRERWTLRLGAEALWLCPRSCRNETRGRAPSPWLRLPLAEIRAVRPGEQQANVPDGDGGRARVTDRWIELELARPAPAPLRRAVDDERADRAGTRCLSYPLEWRGERTLRVYWQTTGLALTPRRERALEALARRVPVLDAAAPPVIEGEDQAPAAIDALARDLHARGRVFDAVRLLRVRRGWSLAHARTWLREHADAGDAA
jgi:hypothetical protein